MSAVKLSSKLLNIRIVLGTSKFAIDMRGEGGLVDRPLTLQLAPTSNSPWRRRGLTFEWLIYYFGMARKEAHFLS